MLSTAVALDEIKTSQKSPATETTLKPAVAEKPAEKPKDMQSAQARLLIISDAADRAASLKASLSGDEVGITCVTDLKQLVMACLCGHDLVIVDVGSADLVQTLRILRSSAGCEEISVLVEASRVSTDPALIGVLPAYRAMPCSHADLITLARRRFNTQRPAYRVARRLL